MRAPQADQMYLSDAFNDWLVPSNDVDGVVLAPYAIVLPRAGKIASVCADDFVCIYISFVEYCRLLNLFLEKQAFL